jgi:nucleoside-diphosphate-sugar epimerase
MKIGISGAYGFVGGMLAAGCRERGHEVVALSSSPNVVGDVAGEVRAYRLGEHVDLSLVSDLDVYVHAAHDFSVVGQEIEHVNYVGAKPILHACHEADVRVLLISSMSSHEHARSIYGKTKFRLEQRVLMNGGAAVRAGIVFGAHAGGIFGSLVGAISAHRAVPVIRTSRCLQLSYRNSLVEVVLDILEREGSGLFAGAGNASYSMREIAESMSRALGQRRLLIPASPTFIFAACVLAETIGVSSPFRSDSVRSLQSGPSAEAIAALKNSGTSFPELDSFEWVDAVRETVGNAG